MDELGYGSLPHPPYLSDLSPTDYRFLKHSDNFQGEKCFTNQDDAKKAFNESIALRTPKFLATGILEFV
ncbi:hypothetical protein Angca_007867, partial [Angiostrongylus cantonensis]